MNPLGIDPVIFEIPFVDLQVRWYGMMYLLGFLIAGFFFKRLSRTKYFPAEEKYVDNFITYNLIGMIVGARLVYVFVYNWAETHSFYDVIAIGRGGLSYHGAILGFLVAQYIFSKKYQVSYWRLTDSAVIAGSPGVFLGRLGNFINGELWGRRTDSWVGMVFPTGGPHPRHPSQLYEAVGEGLLLFFFMWFMHKRLKTPGQLTGLYFASYGVVRFIIEYFRQPDSQLGFYFGGAVTMGQILCFVMIIGGSSIFFYRHKRS